MIYRVNLSSDPHTPLYREIDGDAFDQHRTQARCLRMLELVEEAYDVVIGNYTTFEEVVFRHSVQHLANRHPWGQSEHFDKARRDCHRALANLLSSARAFIDLSCAQVSTCSDDGEADLTELRATFSAQYDARLGYRVMEALRNHTQHHGLSVTGVGFRHGSASVDGKTSLVQAIPYVHMEELRANPKFKKGVLAELERSIEPAQSREHEDFPVLPLVRDYVAGLSLVLDQTRKRFAEREERWAQEIREAHLRYWGEPPSNGRHGFAIEAYEGRRVREEHWVGDQILGRIAALRAVNGPLKWLTSQVVAQ